MAYPHKDQEDYDAATGAIALGLAICAVFFIIHLIVRFGS